MLPVILFQDADNKKTLPRLPESQWDDAAAEDAAHVVKDGPNQIRYVAPNAVLWSNSSQIGINNPFCTLPNLRTTNCDASELLPNAEAVGDCSVALPSGGSCTNIPAFGFTCYPTSCSDGVLTLGTCLGITA
jgi:hypothetical protein